MTAGINGRRLLARLDELALIGGTALGGVTRLAWSPEDRQAVDLVGRWASEAGASVTVDAVGNLIAQRPGTSDRGPPLVTGSHLDTVVAAGPLDGAYGVVAGIEVLASLQARGARLRHPVRVMVYANEEGVVAPPFHREQSPHRCNRRRRTGCGRTGRAVSGRAVAPRRG